MTNPYSDADPVSRATLAALRRNAQPEPFFDVQPNWVRCVVRARSGAEQATA